MKQLERKRKFMLRTSFVNDLSGEFSSKPSTGQTNYFDKEEKARIQFEEDNFVRLPIKKQDKIREKKRMREARDDKIDDFREMENIREVLKLDGMIEEEGKKEERERKLNKTLSGFKKKKGIKKFPKRKF